MKQDMQIKSLLKIISEGIYEKQHILAMSLLCAVAGESIFLLGPPGTAKSLVFFGMGKLLNTSCLVSVRLMRFSALFPFLY